MLKKSSIKRLLKFILNLFQCVTIKIQERFYPKSNNRLDVSQKKKFILFKLAHFVDNMITIIIYFEILSSYTA